MRALHLGLGGLGLLGATFARRFATESVPAIVNLVRNTGPALRFAAAHFQGEQDLVHLNLKQFALGAEKVAFTIAPIAVTALTANPILGNLVGTATQAILAAQQTGLTDAEKKAAVLGTLEQAAPTILAPVATAIGADPQKTAEGVSDLVDALVKVLKGTGQMPAAPAPAAPTPTTSSIPSGNITAQVTDRHPDGSMTINVTLNVGP